jgi:hypothetical protein
MDAPKETGSGSPGLWFRVACRGCAVGGLLVILVLAYVVYEKLSSPRTPPLNYLAADAYLAPGARAPLPADIRFKVTISSNLLPITSAECYTINDAAGLKMAQTLPPFMWKEAGVIGAKTVLYCDFYWPSEDGAQIELAIHCAKGRYTTQFIVNAASLQPWK